MYMSQLPRNNGIKLQININPSRSSVKSLKIMISLPSSSIGNLDHLFFQEQTDLCLFRPICSNTLDKHTIQLAVWMKDYYY